MLTFLEGEKVPIINCDPQDYKAFRNALRSATVYRNTLPTEQTNEGRWVVRKGQSWPTDLLEDGLYPFAVLPDAEVRIARLPRPQGNIDHSELVGGKEVVAAGMVRLKGGRVAYISNESGHYCPSPESPSVALLVFKFWGLPLVESVELDGKFSCY